MVSPTVISLDRIARALGAELVIDFEVPAAGRPGRQVNGGGQLAAPSSHRRLPA